MEAVQESQKTISSLNDEVRVEKGKVQIGGISSRRPSVELWEASESSEQGKNVSFLTDEEEIEHVPLNQLKKYTDLLEAKTKLEKDNRWLKEELDAEKERNARVWKLGYEMSEILEKETQENIKKLKNRSKLKLRKFLEAGRKKENARISVAEREHRSKASQIDEASFFKAEREDEKKKLKKPLTKYREVLGTEIPRTEEKMRELEELLDRERREREEERKENNLNLELLRKALEEELPETNKKLEEVKGALETNRIEAEEQLAVFKSEIECIEKERREVKRSLKQERKDAEINLNEMKADTEMKVKVMKEEYENKLRELEESQRKEGGIVEFRESFGNHTNDSGAAVDQNTNVASLKESNDKLSEAEEALEAQRRTVEALSNKLEGARVESEHKFTELEKVFEQQRIEFEMRLNQMKEKVDEKERELTRVREILEKEKTDSEALWREIIEEERRVAASELYSVKQMFESESRELHSKISVLRELKNVSDENLRDMTDKAQTLELALQEASKFVREKEEPLPLETELIKELSGLKKANSDLQEKLNVYQAKTRKAEETRDEMFSELVKLRASFREAEVEIRDAEEINGDLEARLHKTRSDFLKLELEIEEERAGLKKTMTEIGAELYEVQIRICELEIENSDLRESKNKLESEFENYKKSEEQLEQELKKLEQEREAEEHKHKRDEETWKLEKETRESELKKTRATLYQFMAIAIKLERNLQGQKGCHVNFLLSNSRLDSKRIEKGWKLVKHVEDVHKWSQVLSNFFLKCS